MKTWIWIAALAACGNSGQGNAVKSKTAEEIKKEWGPKAQKKLDKIVKAATAATGVLGTPGDSQLALDFVWSDEKDHPNAIAVQVDDVQSATAPRPEPPSELEGLPPLHPRFRFQDDGHNHVLNAKELLGIEKGSPTTSEHVFRQIDDAKYLLVVTPNPVHWPNVAGNTFEPGTVPLRAILVEIETAKPLGGFETTARSSDEVLVNEKYQKRDEKVVKDFFNQAGRAVVKGIEQRWPGAKTPLDWGFRPG